LFPKDEDITEDTRLWQGRVKTIEERDHEDQRRYKGFERNEQGHGGHEETHTKYRGRHDRYEGNLEID